MNVIVFCWLNCTYLDFFVVGVEVYIYVFNSFVLFVGFQVWTANGSFG